MPVSIFTDAMCAMWIVSSRRPIHRGVYWTTLVGRDQHLRGEQVIAAAQAAGAEHVALRERTPFLPDPAASSDRDDGDRRRDERPTISQAGFARSHHER